MNNIQTSKNPRDYLVPVNTNAQYSEHQARQGSR
jgi:hypothetical protein